MAEYPPLFPTSGMKAIMAKQKKAKWKTSVKIIHKYHFPGVTAEISAIVSDLKDTEVVISHIFLQRTDLAYTENRWILENDHGLSQT